MATDTLSEPTASAAARQAAIGSAAEWSSLHYKLVAGLTIVVPLVGSIAGGYLFVTEGISRLDLAMFLILYVLTVLGIELGYHRYLSHRTLKATPLVTRLLTVLGCMAGHGPPIWWIALHRRHHQHSDHDGDPHSPNLHGPGFWGRIQGGWHSHIGWMFKPENTAAHAAHYARDLLNDRQLQRIDALYHVWMALGLAIPTAIGGIATGSLHGALTGLVWGGLVRLFLGQHALWWGIVTFCHCWGPKPFRSDDDSTNSLLVAVLMLGDGWHNNHHAFPNSAKVGIDWWQIDPTWWAIVVLRRFGLIWDIRVPRQHEIDRKRIGAEQRVGQ